MFRSVSNLIRRNIGWNNLAGIFSLRGGSAMSEGTTESLKSTSLTTENTDTSTGDSSSIGSSTGTDGSINDAPPIIVYTDGSCVENCASGIGVYFGPNHPLNKSKPIHGYEHNSGLAEIIAAKTALKLLQNWKFYRGENVILRTDFLPLIYAMNNDGFNGRFHEEYLELKQLAREFPNGVQFEHVFGHEGEHGNEEANDLARQATVDARLARSRSAPPFRDDALCDRELPKRNRSRSRSRSSWDRTRSRRINSAGHHRSRSAYIPGKYSRRRIR